MRPIHGVVSDMDGVIIDSGESWNQVTQKVAVNYNVVLSKEQKELALGLRIDEFIILLQSNFGLFSGYDARSIAQEICQGVALEIMQEGKPIDGIYEGLAFIQRKGIPIALASSANQVVINAVLSKLQLENTFRQICSAEHDSRGKPDPAVYLRACRLLGIKPEHGIAIEDSEIGIRAAANAGMRCIAVGEHYQEPEIRNLSDIQIPTLHELDEKVWEELLKIKN